MHLPRWIDGDYEAEPWAELVAGDDAELCGKPCYPEEVLLTPAAIRCLAGSGNYEPGKYVGVWVRVRD